jgi:hypothetical protein
MYVLMISYVSREKAMTEGLAFWTDAGIPGIQVSPLPLSLLHFPFSQPVYLGFFLIASRVAVVGLTNALGGTLASTRRGSESRLGPNHFSRFILWWFVFD